MTGTWRLRLGATLLTAMAVVIALPRAGWSRPSYRPQVPTTAEVVEAQRRAIQALAQKLVDPNTRQDDRDEAARRLVAVQTADARRVIRDALIDPRNPNAQLAAARALADEPDPDPTMIDPLFAMLGINLRLSDAAARALLNYRANPQVLTRLLDFVERRPPASEASRIAVISAIGAIPQKRAAGFLVELVTDAEESTGVREAASTALADLTGEPDNGHDSAYWQQWWQANADRSEEEFRSELLTRRSARYEHVRNRLHQLAAEVDKILTEQYRLTAPAQQQELLLKFLRSPDSDVRATAARIVRYEALAGSPPPPPVLELLRDMIADSSPHVRAEVADAIEKINDAGALEALMAQLAREPSAQVRAAIAGAMAPINDIRAVPLLVAMLDDPSSRAALAAADALKALAPKVRDTDPALAQQVARALRRTLEQRAAGREASNVRERLVDAMAPLRQPELSETFMLLLDGRRGESVEVRRLALRGLGEIADPRSIGVIVASLDDNSDRVRLEAVRAMAKNPALPEVAETLRDRMDPQKERDESIRQAAWDALLNAFPELPDRQLNLWAERFRNANDPRKRHLALKALAERQIKNRDEDGLATTRQNIAETLVQLGEFAEAAEYFRLALEFKRTQNVPEAVIVGLMSSRLNALLKARDYPGAVGFGGQMLAEGASYQPIVGGNISNEIEALREAGDLKSARELLAATMQMTPPLSGLYQEKLAEIQRTLQQQNDAGAPPPGPRSAAGTPTTTPAAAAADADGGS